MLDTFLLGAWEGGTFLWPAGRKAALREVGLVPSFRKEEDLGVLKFSRILALLTSSLETGFFGILKSSMLS